MALILMKVAPYGFAGKEKELRYYADLAAQRISPPLLANSEEYILKNVKKRELRNIKLILSSPQKRAIQTAKLIQRHFLTNTKVEIESSLNEVPFSLDGLNPETYSSTKARAKFLQDFVSDKLLESHQAIKARIKDLLKTEAKCNTLCITHTFLMKVIKTLAEVPDLFKYPEILKRNFSINKRLFDYCEMSRLTDKEIRQILNKLN